MSSGLGLADDGTYLSTFYKSLLKAVTHSEFDRPVRGPICYFRPAFEKETAEDEEEEEEERPVDPDTGRNFHPIIFQSLFTVCTRTGPFRVI